MAITDRERQKRRREKLNAEGKVYLSLYLDAEAHKKLILKQKNSNKSISEIISEMLLDEDGTHPPDQLETPPKENPVPIEAVPSTFKIYRKPPETIDPASRQEVHQKIIRLRDSGLNWNEIADLLEAWGIGSFDSGGRFDMETLIHIYRSEKGRADNTP